MHVFGQDGPIKKDVVALPAARAARVIATDKRKKSEDVVTMSRLERWKRSGIIALSECGLTVHSTHIEHEIRATFVVSVIFINVSRMMH